MPGGVKGCSRPAGEGSGGSGSAEPEAENADEENGWNSAVPRAGEEPAAESNCALDWLAKPNPTMAHVQQRAVNTSGFLTMNPSFCSISGEGVNQGKRVFKPDVGILNYSLEASLPYFGVNMQANTPNVVFGCWVHRPAARRLPWVVLPISARSLILRYLMESDTKGVHDQAF
jgi:hypothetical protein